MFEINTAHTWIGYAWTAVVVIWIAASFRNKRTVRRQNVRSRVLQVVVVGLACYLLFSHVLPVRFLRARFLPDTTAIAFVGLVLTIAGLLLALWARFALGTNWSGTPTIKENHELIRTGPYAFVRHPIYSGLLLALLGTVISLGQIRGLLALLVTAIALHFKSRVEERFMTERFGPQYAQYRREVKGLIPFLL